MTDQWFVLIRGRPNGASNTLRIVGAKAADAAPPLEEVALVAASQWARPAVVLLASWH